ncbi:hypothetical protein EXIGLDRAFT_96891 [Exidia glandulosa HHB12029]|uniref:Uncharacterized protein n=1 Tax=Exidia glandulosa HHB12029 TaxID=1314781 RepID=A0A165H3E5_EXIGL|nr:hypothetical protein EXIGLDRAFT_96891 [Exidia glandulosa HHB12029]
MAAALSHVTGFVGSYELLKWMADEEDFAPTVFVFTNLFPLDPGLLFREFPTAMSEVTHLQLCVPWVNDIYGDVDLSDTALTHLCIEIHQVFVDGRNMENFSREFLEAPNLERLLIRVSRRRMRWERYAHIVDFVKEEGEEDRIWMDLEHSYRCSSSDPPRHCERLASDPAGVLDTSRWLAGAPICRRSEDDSD